MTKESVMELLKATVSRGALCRDRRIERMRVYGRKREVALDHGNLLLVPLANALELAVQFGTVRALVVAEDGHNHGGVRRTDAPTPVRNLAPVLTRDEL
jgi:hypothetical protein